MTTARISAWYTEKGFGFAVGEPNPAKPHDRLPSFFIHINDCWCQPEVGMLVVFEEKQGAKGVRGINVRAADVVGGAK